MILEFFKKRWKIYGVIALTLIVYSLMQANSSKAEVADSKIDALDFQIEQLSQSLNTFAPTTPVMTAPKKPILIAQSSKNIAALNVRIANLEEQVRILRGQVDGLQFQLTQMQTFLERQQEDYEFRFEQLEGGAPKKTSAVLQSNSDDAVEEESHIQTLGNSNSSTQILIQGLELATPGQPLGSVPMDTSFAPTKLVTNDDADAQYRAGYDAFIQSNYEFAEQQFKQFVALFPTHPQAPDATNWLGETLLLRKEYNEAAQVLLDGFQSYSASKRAPDLLLKLGMALAGSGERETACRTYEQVLSRYPNSSNALRIKLSQEMQKAKC